MTTSGLGLVLGLTGVNRATATVRLTATPQNRVVITWRRHPFLQG